MDIRDLVKEIKSSFICFPADDINIMNSKICLASFHEFIINNSNFDIQEATDICELIRLYIAENNSFFIDKDSCIRFKLSKKKR